MIIILHDHGNASSLPKSRSVAQATSVGNADLRAAIWNFRFQLMDSLFQVPATTAVALLEAGPATSGPRYYYGQVILNTRGVPITVVSRISIMGAFNKACSD